MGLYLHVPSIGPRVVKRKALLAWLGVLFICTPVVRAGLISSASASTHGVQSATDLASPPQTPLPALSPQLPLASALFDGRGVATTLASELAADFGPDRQNQQITALPPAPDSAVLALSGLLSLGAIQLGRNVRKLHPGALPEWYHGGAVQVGHSTPFDLDLGFNLAALPICAFAQPAEAKRPVFFGAQWFDAARWAPQFWPKTTSPRGPPSAS